MGVDNPVERANEFGKTVKLDKKKKKGSFVRQRINEKEKIEEIQRQKMLKVVEDILMKKKNSNKSEIVKKNDEDDVNQTIKKNIKSLVRQAERNGISKSESIKLLESG